MNVQQQSSTPPPSVSLPAPDPQSVPQQQPPPQSRTQQQQPTPPSTSSIILPSLPSARPKVPPAEAGPSSATTPVAWYQSFDPNAPAAFRGADGKLRFVFGAGRQSAPGVPPPPPPPSQNKPSMPPPASTTSTGYGLRPASAPLNMRIQTPPAPAVVPEAAWTPEKADKSRLAFDIIRSLGRPSGKLGDPLPSSPTPQSAPAGASSSESLKRKPSPSPQSPTPPKRQRMESEESEVVVENAPTEAPPLPTSDVSEVQPTNVAQKEKEASHPMVVEVEMAESLPAHEETQSDAVVKVVATAEGNEAVAVTSTAVVRTHTPEVPAQRELSITSSEAMDVDRVQAMFSGPQSDASSPTSPVLRGPISSENESAVVPDDATDGPPSEPVAGPSTSPSPIPSPPQPPEEAFMSMPAPPESTVTKEGLSFSLPSENSSASTSATATFPLPQPSHKGEGRADDAVTSSISSAPRGSASPRKNKLEPYVLLPALPTYARRPTQAYASLAASASASTSSSRSTSAQVEGEPPHSLKRHRKKRKVQSESVDEVADWAGACKRVHSRCHARCSRQI